MIADAGLCAQGATREQRSCCSLNRTPVLCSLHGGTSTRVGEDRHIRQPTYPGLLLMWRLGRHNRWEGFVVWATYVAAHDHLTGAARVDRRGARAPGRFQLERASGLLLRRRRLALGVLPDRGLHQAVIASRRRPIAPTVDEVGPPDVFRRLPLSSIPFELSARPEGSRAAKIHPRNFQTPGVSSKAMAFRAKRDARTVSLACRCQRVPAWLADRFGSR